MPNFGKLLRNNLLLVGTLGGALLGFTAGLGLKTLNPSDTTQAFISYPGELFFRALKLMILPSIIFSLILGSASLDIKSNGKIAVRTFSYFLATSFFNAVLGIILALAIHPGNPEERPTTYQTSQQFKGQQTSLVDNLFDLGRNIVPANIMTVLFESTHTSYVMQTHNSNDGDYTKLTKIVADRKATNFLGVISLSLVLGSVLSTMGNQAKPLLKVVKICDTVITKIVHGVLWIAPVGVASIICGKVIEVQSVGDLMAQLGLFICTVTIGIFTYQLIFMQLFYFIVIRKNPFKFFVGVLPASISGFVLQSSSGALPVTLQCLDDNVKIDHRISRFVVPLGVTINMDGTALFVTISAIFIAQMHGVVLTMQSYITICFLSTAVSIATGTTPSASLSIIFIILQALGLPLEDIGLLFSVDWLLDRVRTTNNVLGDCYTAAIVEHLSREELKQMDTFSDQNVHEKEIELVENGINLSTV